MNLELAKIGTKKPKLGQNEAKMITQGTNLSQNELKLDLDGL